MIVRPVTLDLAAASWGSVDDAEGGTVSDARALLLPKGWTVICSKSWNAASRAGLPSSRSRLERRMNAYGLVWEAR